MHVILSALLLLPWVQDGTSYPATAETTRTGDQPGVAASAPQVPQELPAIALERLSAGIPWPRGIAYVDGQLAVVARGRHRNYGGPARDYVDHAGRLYWVDPAVSEPYEAGMTPSQAILDNQRVLADPDPAVVHVYDRSKEPVEDTLMNRPYCALVYDPASRNLFLCAYSGVDTQAAPFFSKNATDAVYRFDLRTMDWGIVELHADAVVPADARTAVISNEYYPHHDVAANPPPHGWINGPNSAAVAGNWLYATGKDNHTLARYDLRELREDPRAGPPRSEFVIGETAQVEVLGEVRELALVGHSGVAAGDGWLYLGTRTNSVVVRFPLTPDGDLVQPVVGQLVAEFEPWTPQSGRSADLWELEVGPDGLLYVSCSRAGRIWRFRPDPAHPFDGNDHREDAPTVNRPYIDLPLLTGARDARPSNMTFDDQDRLVFCATFTESHTERAGAIFRVLEQH